MSYFEGFRQMSWGSGILGLTRKFLRLLGCLKTKFDGDFKRSLIWEEVCSFFYHNGVQYSSHKTTIYCGIILFFVITDWNKSKIWIIHCNFGDQEQCKPVFIGLLVFTVHGNYILLSLIHNVLEIFAAFAMRGIIHSHETRLKSYVDIPRCDDYQSFLGWFHVLAMKMYNKLPEGMKFLTERWDWRLPTI